MPQRIFTNGGPVQVGGGLYIERKADHDLLRHCRNGAYAFVLSSRQVGKSSLMNNVARQLKAEDDIESVIVDLQRMGAKLSADQWYQGLLTRIARRFVPDVNVADWWQAHAHLGHADRFTLFLQEELLARRTERIIVFVDEIDTTLSLDFSDDFFAALRAMYNARDEAPEFHRLSFVLIGVATPTDLIDDPKRTPFNIGEFVALNDFTLAEALPLAAGFGLPDNHAREVMQWVMQWTNGHPFLTQQLCRAIAEADQPNWKAPAVADLVATTFFGARAEENIHLKAVRGLLTTRAPKGYEEAMLKTYREVWRGRTVSDEARSIPKSHLKLAGVTVPNGNGTLHLRNDIYRNTFDDAWVKNNMPVDWTKRLQRIALAALAAVLLLNVPVGIYAWMQRGNAIQRANELAVALKNEQQARREAQGKTKEAEAQAQIAKENEERAQAQTAIAEEKTKEAEAQTLLAQQQTLRAEQQTIEANRQKSIAFANERMARHLVYAADMNQATREFEVGNSSQGYDLINSYLPAAQAQENYREFYWYFLWKEKHHEEQTLIGHGYYAKSVAFSSDGKTLASHNSGTITLWDLATRRALHTLQMDYMDSVESVAFSTDGKTLISRSSSGVMLWDVVTGRKLHTMSGSRLVVEGLAFSSDWKTLAGWNTRDEAITLWDLATGRKLHTLRGHNAAVKALAFSSDGKTLVSASDDKTIKLWDVATGCELHTLRGHTDFIRFVAFSSDGKTLVSVSDDKMIKLWDVTTGRERLTMGDGPIVEEDLAFSSDGKTLAYYSGGFTIKLWEVATGRELHTLRGHEEYVKALAFSSDGKTLASASDDKTIKLWDVTTGRELHTLCGHEESVNALAFSSDGKTLASASYDKTIKLWDVTTRRESSMLSGHRDAVTAVAFSSDGKTLASASDDKTIKLWDVTTRRELRTLSGVTNFIPRRLSYGNRTRANKDSVTAIAFSSDGKTLASGNWDNTIKLWDVATGCELHTLRGHTDFIRFVAFSSDGKTLASGGADTTIKLWDVATGRELRTLRGHALFVYAVAFSSDGKTLVSGSADNTIKVWDVPTGRELRTLHYYTSFVMSLAFSSDGKTLASGGDATIKLWDATTWRELRTLRGHKAAVKALAFSNDGKALASGSADKTIKLWMAATEAEVIAHKPDSVLQEARDRGKASTNVR